MKKIITLSACSIFLMSCVSNATTLAPSEKAVQYIDLTSDDKNKISEYWVLENRIQGEYPASAEGILSGCVDVIVLINNSGGVASFEVKKSYPEGVFDDSVAAALKQWKWSAAEKNADKVPVLTTIQFTYMTSSSTGGPKNKDEAERQCGFTNQQQL